MKRFSEKQALGRLARIKDSFRLLIRENFEFRAASCITCETPGACCLDAHFVNVHVSRLEAVAMRARLAELSDESRRSVDSRIERTIDSFELKDDAEAFARTYACPLFEKGIGCLVHEVKPTACIAHACYERSEDLPPDELQQETELSIDRLNRQTYASDQRWLPIPVWLTRLK